jgi:twitching motility protein PilT
MLTVSATHKGYLLTGLVIPSVPAVDAIGVPEAVLAAARSSNGLIVFTGLTGSGKTTLAYSVMDHLNSTGNSHICTISRDCGCEIESKQSFVQHKIVGIDTPDVVSGIRSALDQDVDILLVTELRSIEEVSACLEVAMSGHLVFIVLNVGSPEGAIARLIDSFPPDQQLAVRWTLAQVLRCSSALQLFPKAGGAGRVAAFGVLLPDDEMRDAIRNGKDPLDRTKPLPQGCQTIAEHAAQLRKQGVMQA